MNKLLSFTTNSSKRLFYSIKFVKYYAINSSSVLITFIIIFIFFIKIIYSIILYI